jgi:hypothetical protein
MHRRVGDAVNLEADQVARYLERLMMDSTRRGGLKDSSDEEILSRQWLADQGW